MNVALMNLRITFQKNAVVTDEIGNHKNVWEDYYSCYATISSESGSETETAGQTVPSVNGAFTVRYCKETAAVTSDGFRIRFGDELYNISYIDHQNNKRKSLKFWVQKVRR
jgi:SPP1 family predicted phage head-tail adaptor